MSGFSLRAPTGQMATQRMQEDAHSCRRSEWGRRCRWPVLDTAGRRGRTLCSPLPPQAPCLSRRLPITAGCREWRSINAAGVQFFTDACGEACQSGAVASSGRPAAMSRTTECSAYCGNGGDGVEAAGFGRVFELYERVLIGAVAIDAEQYGPGAVGLLWPRAAPPLRQARGRCKRARR